MILTDIKISLATIDDKNQLLLFFKHYSNPELLERRVDCYISHNFTILAKDGDKIVGTLQWYVKEDPNCGVAEFEEFHVLEEYRGKGTGSSLLSFGVQHVKDYFSKHKIKARRIYAFVGKEREVARHLFEKHGFKQISEVGNLFSDDEIDLIYCLEI